MGRVYQRVMLSDVREDEARFRGILDEAIAKGEVQAWKAYTHESAKSREARMRAANRDGKEAEEYAKKLGVHDKLFGKGKQAKETKKDKDGEAGLAALIQGRQKERGDAFLDSLAAKYGATPGGSKKGKKGKQQAVEEEPDEEAFQAAAARLGKKKAVDEPTPRASKKSRR